MNLKILFYFAIYSFLGWLMESVYRSIIEKKIINSGFLHGPFCPIYGFGAMIMILILQKISNNIIIIFITSTIILTIWEYSVGVILEKIFKTKYWDYSDKKFNINGRICLQNSVYWGIIGVLFLKMIHPFIEEKVNLIPETILFYMSIVIYIIILTDVVVTITKILFIDKKIQQLYEISNMIKEKIVELKESEKLEKVYEENIQKMIRDLKRKQDRIKIKTYKLIVRLKKAFPTMQSEPMNKFMKKYNQLKKKIKNKEK